MKDRHRASQNEIAIFVFGVAAKDLFHGVLLLIDREYRRLFGRSDEYRERDHSSPMKGTILLCSANETRVTGTDLVRGKLFDCLTLSV